MSDHAYDEGYRAGMQKMRELGQSKIATQRNEIARLTQKLEALTKDKAALTKDLKWMRGEK